MTGPAVDPYAETNALANRIAQHIKAHPDDRQAREDLRYIVSVMRQRPTDTTAIDNPPEASAGAQVAAGLASVPGDLAQGVVNTVMHPIQTGGQLTGLGNRDQLRGAFWRLLRGEQSIPETLDQFVRATPFNAGYAPARTFLESTGLKSDEPAPLSEQVRQGGDLAASLLLARYGGPATKRIARAGNVALGGIPSRMLQALFRKEPPTEPPGAGGGPTAPPPPETPPGFNRAYLVRQGYSPEAIDRLIEVWRSEGRRATTNTPPLTAQSRLPILQPDDPLSMPAYQRAATMPSEPADLPGVLRQRPSTVESPSAPPPAIDYPLVRAAIRGVPVDDLVQALRSTRLPSALRQVFLDEFQRRGIVPPSV